MNTPTQHTESWQSPQPAPDNHKLKPPHQIPNTERKFREDADCGGMLQGPNRLMRGQNFFALMQRVAPSAPHDRIVVPGVDHDHYALFDDPRAAMVLFGTAPNTSP